MMLKFSYFFFLALLFFVSAKSYAQPSQSKDWKYRNTDPRSNREQPKYYKDRNKQQNSRRTAKKDQYYNERATSKKPDQAYSKYQNQQNKQNPQHSEVKKKEIKPKQEIKGSKSKKIEEKNMIDNSSKISDAKKGLNNPDPEKISIVQQPSTSGSFPVLDINQILISPQPSQKNQALYEETKIQIQLIQESISFAQKPQEYDEEVVIYDYNLLVLTWVPEHCDNDQDCEKDWLTYDQLRSPSIRSFKPFSSYLNRSEHQYCEKDAYLINFQIYQEFWNVTGLLYDISQYWPATKFTHEEQQFYKAQWVKHGTCYLMNMIEDNRKFYSQNQLAFNKTILVEYFRAAISKFKKLDIVVEPGNQYLRKEDFAIDIGFEDKQSHFSLNCNKDNEILQITICFNRSKLPGKQVTIPCPFDDECDETMSLKLKQPL